jgi:hypothetical protein
MTENKDNGTSTINHIMLFRLAYTVFGFLALICLAFIIIQWYPFVPITFGDAVLDKDVLRPGEALSYTNTFEKHTNKTGMIQRYLQCKKQATANIGSPTLADASMEDKSKRVIAVIPETTMPDVCRIRWVVDYEYFGMRKVSVRHSTPWFQVIAK